MAALRPTVGLISAGAMGSAVAHRLTSSGYTVLTSLAGRSPESIERARNAGMQDVEIHELVRRARYVFSILPPSSAVAFAAEISETIRDRPATSPLVFLDCNAVSPATVKEISQLFTLDTFVDGSIIGGPPSGTYNPRFYLSGKKEVAVKCAEIMKAGGLSVNTMEAGVGEASALKMGYAGINKGLTGLTAAMILATHASSPATSAALMHELSQSQPFVFARTTRMIPDLLPKAYRFVGEMEEISEFTASSGLGGASDIWMGLARLFETVAASVNKGEAAREEEAHKVLNRFVQESKDVIAEKEKNGGKPNPL
ncbi:6-phosphogluconate dehydrogenase C-terminal domain-like protein [Hysterangium stoloniferum]|nr:6-phosphogluconate dehydrogenase C-terminal domain-like protein [Hysterangium stoloniferum]